MSWELNAGRKQFLTSGLTEKLLKVTEQLHLQVYSVAEEEQRGLRARDDPKAFKIIVNEFDDATVDGLRQDVQRVLATSGSFTLEYFDRLLLNSIYCAANFLRGPDVQFTQHMRYQAKLKKYRRENGRILETGLEPLLDEQNTDLTPLNEGHLDEKIQDHLQNNYTHSDLVLFDLIYSRNSSTINVEFEGGKEQIILTERIKSSGRLDDKTKRDVFKSAMKGDHTLKLANDVFGWMIIAPPEYFHLLDMIIRSQSRQDFSIYCAHLGAGLPTSIHTNPSHPFSREWPEQLSNNYWDLDAWAQEEELAEFLDREAWDTVHKKYGSEPAALTPNSITRTMAMSFCKPEHKPVLNPEVYARGPNLGPKYEFFVDKQNLMLDVEGMVKSPRIYKLYTSGSSGTPIYSERREIEQEREEALNQLRLSQALLKHTMASITSSIIEFPYQEQRRKDIIEMARREGYYEN